MILINFLPQPRVWKELLLAAIGEQFIDDVCKGDDICGLSVSPREKDDLLQIWNVQSEAVEESKVLEKIHKLLPDVRFNAEFYKRKNISLEYKSNGMWLCIIPMIRKGLQSSNWLIFYILAHQTHSAFEGAKY